MRTSSFLDAASSRRDDGSVDGRPADLVSDGPAQDAGSGDPDSAAAGLVLPHGEVLVSETFDDANFSSRGWYDLIDGEVTSEEHAPASKSSLVCTFDPASRQCAEGSPGRILFRPSAAIHVSYWVRYSSSFSEAVEIFLHTDVDDPYIGPASAHLSINLASTKEGIVYLRMEDNDNVDPACVRLTGGEVVGCDGKSFDDYPFTENRSVCACNGILGDLDEADCFEATPGRYFSRRYWYVSRPYVRNTWHLVEVYLRLNSVVNGVGQVDGAIHLARDGEVLLAYDRILMRTGQHPKMLFNQLIVAPVYGEGRFWIDDLTISAAP